MSGTYRDAFRAPVVTGRPCELVPHGQVRGSLLECKNAFHAEILTPSACYTILSLAAFLPASRVFSRWGGGGLKLAREGTRWASERRKREERTHGS